MLTLDLELSLVNQALIAGGAVLSRHHHESFTTMAMPHDFNLDCAWGCSLLDMVVRLVIIKYRSKYILKMAKWSFCFVFGFTSNDIDHIEEI